MIKFIFICSHKAINNIAQIQPEVPKFYVQDNKVSSLREGSLVHSVLHIEEVERQAANQHQSYRREPEMHA